MRSRRRSSRSRSPASWPRRWTLIGPPRSPASYVPNQYTVWLSAEDHQRLEGYERSLEQELSGYLLEHARRHDYALLTRPEGRPRDRRAPSPGRVRDPDPPREAAGAAGRGALAGRAGAHDGLLGSARSRPAGAAAARGASGRARRRSSRMDDRRYVLDGPVAVVGRSRECDCVLRRPQRLAPARRAASRVDRRLADRRSRLDQRDQGQRPARGQHPALTRATR